jgi:hypothetical protein
VETGASSAETPGETHEALRMSCTLLVQNLHFAFCNVDVRNHNASPSQRGPFQPTFTGTLIA